MSDESKWFTDIEKIKKIFGSKPDIWWLSGKPNETIIIGQLNGSSIYSPIPDIKENDAHICVSCLLDKQLHGFEISFFGENAAKVYAFWTAIIEERDEMRDEIKQLHTALKNLVHDVENCLDDLDPCAEDPDSKIFDLEMGCSKYHNLSLDSLPAAIAFVKKGDE